MKMMASPDDFTGPVNLGNPDEFTISELADIVIDKLETSSKIIYKPLPGDDPQRRRPDISKARKYLNWEPKVSLEDGLTKTIEYFKCHLECIIRY